MADNGNELPFSGFDEPTQNWSKLPHALVAALPLIETGAELKVILYILRHTWGFRDDEKRITLDEFESGRRRADGTRFDEGTGLSRPSIIDGLRRAETHGFINVEVDDSDAGRIRKIYSIRMRNVPAGVNESDPTEVKELDRGSQETLPRTEKETSERNNTTVGGKIEEPGTDSPSQELLIDETVERQGVDETENELDAFLGSRPAQPRPQLQIPAGDEPWLSWGNESSVIRNWRREDVSVLAIRALGYWMETTLHLVPEWSSQKPVKTWAHGLADLYLASRGDLSVLTEAARHLQERGIVLTSPYSLVNTARGIRAKRQAAPAEPPPNRGPYLGRTNA